MRDVAKALLLVAGLSVFGGVPLEAQTIRVQSGDHQGFTRLVLPIGADRDWELEQQSNEQWTLSLSPTVDGFDTSTAFNLIQRTRLANLTSDQTLSLGLACACEVSSFRHDNRFLVIDISDPDPNEVTAAAPADDLAAQAREAAAAALPDLADLLQEPADLPEVTPLAPPESSPQPILPQTNDAPNPRLAEAAQIMAEQLARAAASGLLDVALNTPMTIGDPMNGALPSPVIPTDEEAPIIADDEINSETAQAPPAATITTPEGPLPIRAETAFDTVLQLELPIGPPRAEASCDGAPFDLAQWSEGGGLHQGLGSLRRDLYDERDVLTPDGAIALAQHYLYYGFGAEAAHWLNQLPDPPETLLRIAALLDGAEIQPFPRVETTEDCSDGELLWRYLAGALSNTLEAADTAAIQRAFSTLPPELRDHTGPDLARQLVAEGYAGTARNIRDILHRGGRFDTAALQLLDLDLGIALETSADQTQQILAEALRDDGGEPANVLAHALAFDRSTGTPPNPTRLVTADALIREIGDGPQTDDLWRETLLGHAALGQIDEALNRLGDPARSDDVRAEALTELIAERVAVGDTAALVILAYTFGRDWRPEGSVAGRIQVRAIAALRDEGLFEAAQILRDVRRPLILPAPEQPASEVQDPAALAWNSEDWSRLAETGTGTHADIASRLAQIQDGQPAPIQGPPDLNALAETVSDSRALRSAVADLLAQPTLP